MNPAQLDDLAAKIRETNNLYVEQPEVAGELLWLLDKAVA